MAERAAVFIDGNNWYHGLRDRLRLPHLPYLDYATISKKLLGPRKWICTAKELRNYLTESRAKCDPRVFRDLMALAANHLKVTVMVEKAVDVHLVVDMVMMAEWDEYDAAYLLSADGDFTPAVKAARSLGKKVYAASPLYGARLATDVNAFIRLDSKWFDDCYRS